MTKSTIFLGGVYGVGKTTLCSKLASKIGIEYFSASDLISETTNEKYGVNKYVSDKVKNQNALIASVNKKLKEHNTILLAGHFCILDNRNNVDIIPAFVFNELHIKSIIVLEADLNIVDKHIFSRDAKKYSVNVLKRLMSYERDIASDISKKLDIPLFIHKMSFSDEDVEIVANFIKNL